MIESITISGGWLIALFVFALLSAFGALIRILYPNYIIKKILAGKTKMTNDSWIRFCGVIWFTMVIGFILYVLGYIS